MKKPLTHPRQRNHPQNVLQRLSRAIDKKITMETEAYKYGKFNSTPSYPNASSFPWMPHRSYKESMDALAIQEKIATKIYNKTFMPNHYEYAKERYPKREKMQAYRKARQDLFNHFKLINFHINNLHSQVDYEMKRLTNLGRR